MTYTQEAEIQGSKRVEYLVVTLTGVTGGHIKTGLSNIKHATFINVTTEGDGQIKINRNSADNAVEYGGLLLAGFTSGDSVNVKVEGN